MKAEDLMIGNFLFGSDKSILRVVSLAKDGIYFDSKEGEGVSSFDHLKPIPLTTEILEKNGWSDVGKNATGITMYHWRSKDKMTEITIWLDSKIPMDIYKNIRCEDETCYTLPYPCYVHELQNALRLCGITKEIEL